MSDLLDTTSWAVTEFADADLGDLRRTQRLVQLAHTLAQRPGAALPEACGSGAMLKAAYRFFTNDDIAPDDILQSHIEATYSRLNAAPLVLAVQDTTEANWTNLRVDRRLGTAGELCVSRLAGPYHLSHHPRARPLGPVGPTGLGAGPGRHRETGPAQAAPHQPEGKSEVAPQS